jgi:hypothetical protein
MGWESPEMAREVHAPTSEDLSASANIPNGSRPPTAEAREGGEASFVPLRNGACIPRSGSREAGGTTSDVDGVGGWRRS